MGMVMEEGFCAAYAILEERMRSLADGDADVFLPNPRPLAPVRYIFVCMEPSMGRWARTAEEGRAKVRRGFRNFLFSTEDFLLHFCIRRYLCKLEEQYHITDVSKGAMLVARAGRAREARYVRWYSLLQEEVGLLAAPGAVIFAVGRAVSNFLREHGFEPPFTSMIHYSPQAAAARTAAIRGCEDQFREFAESVCIEDIVEVASDILIASGQPQDIAQDTLSRLQRSNLSLSRKRLMFCYKRVFESVHMKGECARAPDSFSERRT